ncbi:Aste57867_15787 [Aphanomyces stellatus]|uniref:Aste57867_15787 protein n=1 Tax=Aphanomyces stellatus TaxID=120398 RepID=A0A485L4H6_9STRA|nr:hypothetical protein As57867_015731 [Aphanomyces stellatus]VFT92575.1 Aste57867_15787 [Aphanomyces stellatus]
MDEKAVTADDDKATPDEQWACPECTLLNSLVAQVCEACGATSPLVLDALAREDAAGDRKHSDEDAPSEADSRPSRASSLEDDFKKAVELDPWSQAEDEWARVEATQATKASAKAQRK